ncbi:hypothetical protein CRENBAI_009586 [Crenichthys baileyi]|uniref:Uncharacterized protein n=1 Tax=Crenichthys baileyi TaxID=28760 RepID=A0AAV9RKB3_9TELE
MLPALLHSGVLRYTNRDRMFPPKLDLADGKQESARDRWVQQQMEEAMRHLPADLEVLPSPLLLEQMECEAVQRCSLPAPLVAHPDPAAKPASSSRRRKRRHGAPSCCSAGEEVGPMPAYVRAAASNPASSSAPPMPSSLAPVRCYVATPDKLEEQLRFYARQIKSFWRTSLLYSSPELMEKIRLMEEDYRTAVRQFYCCPPPYSPSLQSTAAEQPTPGLQSSAERSSSRQVSRALLLWSSPGQVSGALLLQSSPRQNKAAALPTPCLQNKVAAQSTSFLQSAAIVPPKSASTSSTRHRGRWKRDASAQPLLEPLRVWPTPQPLLKPLRVPATPLPLLKSLRVPATPQLLLTPLRVPATPQLPAQATEGRRDASASASGLKAFQGLSERLVLVLVPGPCDEGFEDEPPSEPVPERFKDEPPPDPERFKERLVLILASDEGFEDEPSPDPVPEQSEEKLVLILTCESGDKGFEDEPPLDPVPVSKGPQDSASASEGTVGAASASEGPVGSVPVSEVPLGTVKSKLDSKPDSKPPEFHRVSGGFSMLHG